MRRALVCLAGLIVASWLLFTRRDTEPPPLVQHSEETDSSEVHIEAMDEYHWVCYLIVVGGLGVGKRCGASVSG